MHSRSQRCEGAEVQCVLAHVFMLQAHLRKEWVWCVHRNGPTMIAACVCTVVSSMISSANTRDSDERRAERMSACTPTLSLSLSLSLSRSHARAHTHDSFTYTTYLSVGVEHYQWHPVVSSSSKPHCCAHQNTQENSAGYLEIDNRSCDMNSVQAI